MPKFIFSNIIGTFVFSKDYELVDSKLVEKSTNLDETIKAIQKKHSDVVEPDSEQLKTILTKLDGPKLRKNFREQNVLLTKTAIKESVSKDNLLIQTIDSIEEIDRTINLLTKRLREWYALYLPEVEFAYDNHEQFVFEISKKSKEQLLKDLKISENDSMGGDFSKDDLDALHILISQISNLFETRKKYDEYLEKIQKKLCPNLQAVGGTAIAAKLLAHAGSLKRLAEMPASTLQVLGAEKALFRHIKNKKKNLPPKYGLLHEHQLIQKSNHKDHGKVARALADKLSFAARIDFYKGEFVGDKYKKELIDKFGIKY